MASTENEDEISLSLPQILDEIEKDFSPEKGLCEKNVNLLFSELKKYDKGNEVITTQKSAFGTDFKLF